MVRHNSATPRGSGRIISSAAGAGMSVVDKHGALRQHSVVPVVCAQCTYATELPRPAGQTCSALIETSYYRGFVSELYLLERTRLLFDRFPRSRHPVMAEHLHLDPNEVPTAVDAEFERALRRDAELLKFLTQGSFLLPRRLQFVRQSVSDYERRAQEFRVPCPACEEGALSLEQAFFESLM